MTEDEDTAPAPLASNSPNTPFISAEQRLLADIIVEGIKGGASANEIALMILKAGYVPPSRRD